MGLEEEVSRTSEKRNTRIGFIPPHAMHGVNHTWARLAANGTTSGRYLAGSSPKLPSDAAPKTSSFVHTPRCDGVAWRTRRRLQQLDSTRKIPQEAHIRKTLPNIRKRSSKTSDEMMLPGISESVTRQVARVQTANRIKGTSSEASRWGAPPHTPPRRAEKDPGKDTRPHRTRQVHRDLQTSTAIQICAWQ